MDLALLGSDTDRLTSDGRWTAANLAVYEDPSSFEAWEYLVNTTETVAGEGSIYEPACKVMEHFLAKYPLLFGYWKKYSDYVKRTGGIEMALQVCRKSIEAFPQSVDLWTDYLSMAIENKEDQDAMRDLIHEGAEACGRDFLSHPFWDKALEYEAAQAASTGAMGDHKLDLLKQIILYPLHQYARYWEEFTKTAAGRPVAKVLYEGMTEEVESTEAAVELLKEKVFARTQQRTMDKWKYESAINRNYFHVAPLDDEQLTLWNDYLDYEEGVVESESTGVPFTNKFALDGVDFLYKRALVPGAALDSLWLRYTRWLTNNIPANVRMAYRLASTVFVPTSRPQIRFNYALYEESLGNSDQAQSIFSSVVYSALGQKLSRSLLQEVLIQYLQFYRRQHGLADTVKYCQDMLTILGEEEDEHATKRRKTTKKPKQGLVCAEDALLTAFKKHKCPASHVSPVLVVEMAKLVRMANPSANWRSVFEHYRAKCLDSTYYWTNNFQFELDSLKHPLVSPNPPNEVSLDNLMKFNEALRSQSQVPIPVITDIMRTTLSATQDYGSHKRIQGYVMLDPEVNGSLYCQTWLKKKLASDGRLTTTNRRLKAEAGHPGFEFEQGTNFDATCQRYIKEQKDASGHSVA